MNLLLKIQQSLKAPKLQYNSFAKYNYRSQEDILEAVKPLLKKEGTLTLSDEVVQVGNFNYIKATATLTDSEGNIYTTSAFAREEETKKGMDSSQMTGTASSYARKYALNGLFAIDDNKDADTMDNTKEICSKCNNEMKWSNKNNKYYCPECVKNYYNKLNK